MERVGAQLYTVRECLTDERSMACAMEKVGAIGYTAVQLFGSAEFAARLAKAAVAAGLRVIGVLADVDAYEHELDAYVSLCRTYGAVDLGVSGFVTEAEEVAPYIQRVNNLAQTVGSYGLTFSYHNHAAEFKRLPDGKTIMERYMEEFDTTVRFMPDTYWIQRGGCDVRWFLERVQGRVDILHLKDMTYCENGEGFAEVGRGNLYMDGILQTALSGGVTEFVVEQDRCDGDPFESLAQSFAYLASWKG